MAENKNVLITGVSGYWGARFAARLIDENERLGEKSKGDLPVNYHVIGVDSEPPADAIRGLDFIQADVRNPLLVDIMKSEQVDSLVHLAWMDSIRASEKAFDLNVIGTMKVLGAAAEAKVKKIVLKSSTSVYGAYPTNPAFLSEDQPLNGNKDDPSTRYLVEVEAFCNGFRGQMPDLALTILRFANVISPNAISPMSRYLRMSPPPVLFGFDPLMQIIHEDDVLEAMLFSLNNDISGVYNIAAEQVLPLSKILGLVGKMPLPLIHLCAYWSRSAMKAAGVSVGNYYPIELDYLRYSCVTDLGKMRAEMRFTPLYSAASTLREYAGHLRVQKIKTASPDLTYDAERLRDTLDRRQRQRVKVEEPVEKVEGAAHER